MNSFFDITLRQKNTNLSRLFEYSTICFRCSNSPFLQPLSKISPVSFIIKKILLSKDSYFSSLGSAIFSITQIFLVFSTIPKPKPKVETKQNIIHDNSNIPKPISSPMLKPHQKKDLKKDDN